MSQTTPLRPINWVNLVAFIINAVFTYTSNAGLLGGKTNGELSEKYSTLITPSGWAFSIWGIIFIYEAAFVLCQMLPRFRDNQIVDQISYFWAGACFCQALWSIAFSFEEIWLSMVLMVGIALCLSTICWRLQTYTTVIETDKTSSQISLLEYWALVAPFSIHGGWITVATLLNVNVTAVRYATSYSPLVTTSILSLCIVSAIYVLAFHYNHGNVIYSLVLAWALFGISINLQKPNDMLKKYADPIFTDGLSGVASFLSIVIVVGSVLQLFVLGHKICFTAGCQHKNDLELGEGKPVLRPSLEPAPL